jgi:hypothetical protein
MSNKSVLVCGVLALALGSLGVSAKVSQQEADKLGTSLTPFGSIKSGNISKTIPEWTGGLTQAPVGYSGGGQHHIDPYGFETPKFTIDKSNYQGFSKYLSAGQYKLFESYPDTFKMNVYQTHRSHAMPDWVLKNSKKNALTSVLVKEGVGMKDAYAGIPFPILHGSNADKAIQVIWNHKTRFRGLFFTARATELAVQRDGVFTQINKHQELFMNFYNPEGDFASMENVMLYFLTTNKAPARLAGGAVLVHETLNQFEEPRQAWDYNSGQRRVRRAPNLAYDSPIASSDGTRVADDTDIFVGASDRYDWSYRGMREVFIPYNSYKVGAAGVKYADVVMAGHPNPEYIRWELHRVHVVEANLKKNERHIYKRRVFYADEDSWALALADQYDSRDELWRVSMGLLKNYYELPATYTGGDVYHDLQSRRFSMNFVYSEEQHAPIFEHKIPDKRYFSPSELRRKGR